MQFHDESGFGRQQLSIELIDINEQIFWVSNCEWMGNEVRVGSGEGDLEWEGYGDGREMDGQRLKGENGSRVFSQKLMYSRGLRCER